MPALPQRYSAMTCTSSMFSKRLLIVISIFSSESSGMETVGILAVAACPLPVLGRRRGEEENSGTGETRLHLFTCSPLLLFGRAADQQKLRSESQCAPPCWQPHVSNFPRVPRSGAGLRPGRAGR